MHDVLPIIPAFVVALVWALRELIPILARELRRRRADSEDPPPVPPVRDTLPTPQFLSADGTGPHAAMGPHGTYREGVQPHPFVTRPELREVVDTLREMSARIDELSRTVGRLEGAIQHLSPMAPRPPRPRPGGR